MENDFKWERNTSFLWYQWGTRRSPAQAIFLLLIREMWQSETCVFPHKHTDWCVCREQMKVRMQEQRCVLWLQMKQAAGNVMWHIVKMKMFIVSAAEATHISPFHKSGWWEAAAAPVATRRFRPARPNSQRVRRRAHRRLVFRPHCVQPLCLTQGSSLTSHKSSLWTEQKLMTRWCTVSQITDPPVSKGKVSTDLMNLDK